MVIADYCPPASYGGAKGMSIEAIVRYLLPDEARSGLRHPASAAEARAVMDRHPEVSCLAIRQQGSGYCFEELLCENRTCIDRSRNIFDSIRRLIGKHQLPLRGERFLFHFKGDACEYRPDFPLLSNSRNVGNERVILWPLLIRNNYLLSFARYSPYLHDEITRYRHKPDQVAWADKRPMFFFRGRNSGNPFSSVQYPWNRFRCSRQMLLDEALRLPDDLRARVDIGFNELYPKVVLLRKNKGRGTFLAERFGQHLADGSCLADVQNDITLLLSHIKPALGMTQMYLHKYQLCPEGFDCSSALSWVLASNSLAIVPPFHYENVIINSRQLQPYRHFLPIREDYADLAEVMRWALEHDEECRQMVCEASAYMRPFVDETCMEAVQTAMLEILLK